MVRTRKSSGNTKFFTIIPKADEDLETKQHNPKWVKQKGLPNTRSEISGACVPRVNKDYIRAPKEPQLGDLRYAVCEHTKKWVKQSYDGQDWVCLHDDTESDTKKKKK
jgi:hypothetical protein